MLKNFMKLSLAILLLLFSFRQLRANDKLMLKNGRLIPGSVIDVAPSTLIFQSSDKKQEILKLSPEQVDFVTIEKVETLYWIQDSLYRKGVSDAIIHHKRFGRNFLAGFFGVQWGFIVVALVNPKLPDPNVVGQDNFNNLSYREGYRKKAKEKNVLNALAGLVFPLILIILISTGGEWSLM